MQLQEKELSEINIGEALPVKEGLDFALEYVDFGVSKVVGSVKDGIIGNKTNSLKTIDSDIEWLKAPVGQWAKAATWTQQELEKMSTRPVRFPMASDVSGKIGTLFGVYDEEQFMNHRGYFIIDPDGSIHL